MIYFFDIEGTLSTKPIGTGENNKVTLSDLLNGTCFCNMKANNDLVNFAKNIPSENIYIISTIDSYNEIDNKIKWLKQYLPNITIENQIYISSEYTKGDAIISLSKIRNLNTSEIIFIDDKQSNLDSAIKHNITSYLPNDFIKTITK